MSVEVYEKKTNEHTKLGIDVGQKQIDYDVVISSIGGQAAKKKCSEHSVTN